MLWSNVMHIERRGQGPDLVMLHGWSMHSGVWHLLAEGLAENFTLHLVDLPGHGHSDWQHGAFELENILPQLAENTPEQAVWIGWSLGGLIALAFARCYPQQVTKLSLMAATPLFVQKPDWPCAMEANVFESFAENLDADQQQTLQRFLMLQAKGAEQSRMTIRELSQQLAMQHTPEPAALHAGLDCLLNLDMRAALAELVCPVQLILGSRDTLIPASLTEHALALNPQLSVSLIEGGGHAPFIAQPSLCQQLVEQFIHG
jgi:pimeloyl-[acyl-carrier protein] methyl ester esterase